MAQPRDTRRIRAATTRDPMLVAMDAATDICAYALDRMTEIRTGKFPSPTRRSDTDLIDACEEAIRCEGVICDIDAGRLESNDAETHAANQNWDAAFDRVAVLPAASLASLRAKAAALRMAVLREAHIASGDWTPLAEGKLQTERHDRIALSLCSDIAALLGDLTGRPAA